MQGSQKVAPKDEEALLAALALGPVLVAVEADTLTFQAYVGGVLESPECLRSGVDHALLLVGYGNAADGTPYWKAQNEWGVHWGEGGYIRLKRGANICGVESAPIYPVGVRPVESGMSFDTRPQTK